MVRLDFKSSILPTALAVLFGVLAFGAGALPSRLCAQESDVGGALKVNLDLPFDSGGGDNDDEDAPEGFVFYTQNYEGDGVFFCLDRSSSTSNNGELEREKRETVRVINEFSSHVQFGVVFYDLGVLKFPQSGRPAEATEAGKSQGKAFTLNTPGGGGSCVKGGLLECLNFVSRSTAKRNLVIWLGDGFTHCQGMDLTTYSNQTLAEVKARNYKRAQINAICVGPQNEVNESFPKTLAAMNNGTYTRIVR